jgi:hypothetical protein
MNFFIKRSKVIIDCFTDNLNAAEYFPIAESNNFYPDWWKNLPKTHVVGESSGIEIAKSTMKSCDGFIALYKQGFMIPLWSDLIVETQANGFRYTFADEISHIGSHDYDQMSTEFMSYIHFKIQSPWFLKESKGIEFLFTQPTYNQVKSLSDWHILPGIVDFKYQRATNINFVASRGRRIQINAGHPVAHLIPLTEKEIDLRIHLINPSNIEDLKIKNNFYPFFRGSYKKIKKILEEKERKKCPFGKS